MITCVISKSYIIYMFPHYLSNSDNFLYRIMENFVIQRLGGCLVSILEILEFLEMKLF